MGLKPFEYYCLTPYEYDRICEGYTTREGLTSHYFRYLIFVTWNLQVSKKDQLKKPSELWEIPALDGPVVKKSEETEDQQKQNYEEFQRMVNLYK